MKSLFGSLVLFVCCSCVGSNQPDSGIDAGAQFGVVPADLRDVERAGEGLFATTFGEFPARSPNWGRATSVQGILKEVWGRTKTANPTYPAAQVTALDKAIVDLDAAIAAMDQKKATFAANAVGLAVPELFAFFHPDAPIEVIRMDAVFRQVGIDAHFNERARLTADIAILSTDWNNSKSAVATRVPTCHRVAGTATVTGDIEQSLSNLATADSTNNMMSVEVESDNGALEIDTLELLYDCPPDGSPPVTGEGSACVNDSSCGAGSVCDLANAGGRCAPSPSTAKVGGPCTTTLECGTNSRSACFTAAGDNWPGGHCALEPCNDVQVCPPGATCVAIGGETPSCLKGCTVDTDCRVDGGYVCQLFVTTPPKGFGPTNKACAFPCGRDADCQAPLTCDLGTKKCRP